jgi:hypothetical protein
VLALYRHSHTQARERPDLIYSATFCLLVLCYPSAIAQSPSLYDRSNRRRRTHRCRSPSFSSSTKHHPSSFRLAARHRFAHAAHSNVPTPEHASPPLSWCKRHESGQRAMEAAAKTVELLMQRTLPDRPFYLSNSPDWRYQPPSDGSRRFEEWHCNRLQYSTLLSEADRGVLLTRPDYDMREEPSKPLPREISTLAKAGGDKKKLSLSDYKNKKTVSASASPPEPAIARIKEAEHAGASNPTSPAASAPRHSSDDRPPADTRRSTDSRPSDVRRPRDSEAGTDGKQRSSRDSLPAVDMR